MEEARVDESHSQGGDIQKKGPGEKVVTLKQRLLEERRQHYSHNTRRGI